MKNTLLKILSYLVDNPDKLVVEEQKTDPQISQFIIHADQNDIGKIIGKEGKIIQAVRNVMKILAVKEKKLIRIQIA